MARESDFISETREAARDIWNAYNRLKGLQVEWTALDYGTILKIGEGTNEGLTKVEVGAVVFDTTDAITTLLGTGHATNLAKLL